MANHPLPKRFQWNLKVNSADDMWRKILTEGDPMIKHGREPTAI